MIDLAEQVNEALKKLKMEVTHNQFTLDDVTRIIRATTGCEIDEEVERLIPGMLALRHDLRPLGGDGERWYFGSYTPSVSVKKEAEHFA